MKRRSHRRDAFEDVYFPSLMVGVVSAAVAVDGELADIGGEGRVGELRRVFDAVDEAGFGESVVAAVEPDVETIGLAGIVASGMVTPMGWTEPSSWE